jgi:hypothetical protein
LTQERISIRPLAIELKLFDSTNHERRDSRFAGIFEPLPWPSHEWNVSIQDPPSQVAHGELVAADAPAFIGFDQAAAAFFAVPPTPNRSFSGRELVIREQDRRARIDAVRVRPTEILATVSGQALGGTELTLAGDGEPRTRLTPKAHEVRLSLPYGLNPGAWLALHRDQELLDRRLLDAGWGGADFELEVDPRTRLDVLISGGEGPTTEFKQQLPGTKPGVVMKTAAAFANGAGGTLLFGVDDDGHIVGLDHAGKGKAMDRVTNLLTDWVRPRVHFQLEHVHVNDAQVLIVDIDAGADPPYGIGTTDHNVVYYVRRGATSFRATPADIRALVRSRLQPTTDPHFPFPHR